MYNIDPAEVRTVLLPDGQFHRAKLFAVTDKQFTFRNERGDTIAGPVSSILAITGPAVLTSEEVAEAAYLEEEKRKDAEALFRWRTYTDTETYLAAVEPFCPECGTLMTDQPITHYYEGRVLCQRCSPLQPRYGRPV